MKKTAASIILVALLFFAGCKDEFRIYSIAILDKSSENSAGLLEIRDSLSARGVKIIDQDSLSRILDVRAIEAHKIRLCAGMRSDRLSGAVALGKQLEVDAVVFSAMPSAGKTREKTPCLIDSLVSLYLVEPPRTLVEARSFGEFMALIEAFEWETIVRPPPPPEEFALSLGDTIDFAGYSITIRNFILEEKGKADSDQSLKGAVSQKMKSQELVKGDDGHNPKVPATNRWSVVFLQNGSSVKVENFDLRTVGSVKGAMKFDISYIDSASGPSFKAVLTDLRE